MNIESNAREWIKENTNRTYPDGTRSYEVDYGTHWTMDGTFSNEMWRVSWNMHSGILYAYDLIRNRIIKLAKFSTLGEVDQAMKGWQKPLCNFYRNLPVLAKHLQEIGRAI